MLSRHVLIWTSFVASVLITFSDTLNVSRSTLHPQARSSIPVPAKHLKVIVSPKLPRTNHSASNGHQYTAPRKNMRATTTANNESKSSTLKQSFAAARNTAPIPQDDKTTTGTQNVEKLGLAARKNNIHINLNRNFNQARRNMRKSILNTQIQIISNYPIKSRNIASNNARNPHVPPSTKKFLTTARPRQNNIPNHKSGPDFRGAGVVMNPNYLSETVHVSGGHGSNPEPNKFSTLFSNFDANMLDYKKVTSDSKIKIRKQQAIVSNALRLNNTIPKKPSSSRKPDLGIMRSTPNTFVNITRTEAPSMGFTMYSRNTDPLHAFFPDYADQHSPRVTTTNPKNETKVEENYETFLNKSDMVRFREKIARAVTLNDNKDIPPFLFRCLPNEVIDCESDKNYNYVVDSLLLKPESLKDDMDLMQKIYTRLQQVNITWPDGYVFNKTEFAILANDSMVAGDIKSRPQSDEISVIKKYKFVREIFSTVAAAPHKPGDIFITDVVREIIKIKSVFVKRKILDLLFYKILNPAYIDENDTATDNHRDDDKGESNTNRDDDVTGESHTNIDESSHDITDPPHVTKDVAEDE